jgi:hypothetical protein
MFEPFIVFLILAAALFVVGSWLYSREVKRCPKYRYVYKPAFRTFVEEQTQPASVFRIYADMFYKPSLPTFRGFTGMERNFNGGTINPFLLGGLPTTDLGTVRESDSFLNQ